MAELKPTVAGLMRLVDKYGTERQTGQEMPNDWATKQARDAVLAYAKRLAAAGVAIPREGEQQ